jgi:hypothetical protein
MFNVNQITSQLAKMPDQALQQYAAMHKNDPYTVSLALAESNRRKDMRMGATPQPGQMPKVVDQDIAQMVAPPPQQMMPQQARPQMPPQAQQQLPENTGIGQLPAQNMQGMADGGIVGYAEGGVPRFNGMTGSVPSASMFDIFNMNPQDARAYAEMLKEQRAAAAAGISNIAANPTSYLSRAGNLIKNTVKSYIPAVDVANSLYFTSPEELATLRKADTERALKSIPQSSISGTASSADVDKAIGLPAIQTVNGTPTGGQPSGQPKRPGAAPSTAGGPATTAPGITGLPSETDTIKRLKENMVQTTEKPLDEDAFLKRLGDISKPAYDKAHELISSEKDRLKEGKEQDFYMSLIQGGLAAAGESGPNALQNIAKGFEKGAGNYAAALKDFRKASQENAKMDLELARAEAADKKGDVKTLYERMDKYQDRQLKRDDTINHGIAQIINTTTSGQFGIAQANVTGGYGVQQAKIHKEGQIAASMAPQNLMTALGEAKPGSALRTGFDLQTLKAHAATLQDSWSKIAYPNGTMGEPNAAFLARYPTPQAYIKENLDSMDTGTSGGIVQQAPPGATVIPKKQP